MTVPLVAGIDSSTQACTIVLRDADDGRIVGWSEEPHPPVTPPASEQDPRDWWNALGVAASQLDLRDVVAVSVDGQGHGLVALDAVHEVIRPAKLWNDTTSWAEADELVARLGRAEWARRTGIVPVSAITVAKLLWLARHEPANFARLATILLPPDYLTHRLTGGLTTDRSEGSGTGYFAAATSTWDLEVLALVDDQVDWRSRLPRILGPIDCAGIVTRDACEATGLPIGIPVGPGANDQPVNALALGTVDGDVIVSLGTSGAVSARSLVPVVGIPAAPWTGSLMLREPTCQSSRRSMPPGSRRRSRGCSGSTTASLPPSRWRLRRQAIDRSWCRTLMESERRTGQTPGASSPECAPT